MLAPFLPSLGVARAQRLQPTQFVSVDAEQNRVQRATGEQREHHAAKETVQLCNERKDQFGMRSKHSSAAARTPLFLITISYMVFRMRVLPVCCHVLIVSIGWPTSVPKAPPMHPAMKSQYVRVILCLHCSRGGSELSLLSAQLFIYD